MKHSISVACIYIFLVGLVIVNYSFADEDKIKKTAVGIWLFEGDANDSSGNKNHGQLQKGAKIASNGKFGNALSLDGKDKSIFS